MHLVGYLYYWQMGFNSVFKGLTCCVTKAKREDNLPPSKYCTKADVGVMLRCRRAHRETKITELILQRESVRVVG